MRGAVALIVAMVLSAGAAGPVAAPLEAAASAGMLDQQPAPQPQQPATSVEQDDGEITSAGWANILWIVIVLVAGAAFVWLAMVGLRTRSRE